MNFIDIEELEYSDEGVYLIGGKPFTGITREYRDSNVLSELSLQNGIENGEHRGWYFSGQLKWEGYYLNGSGHGLYREWYENGMPAEESIIDNGRPLLTRKWNNKGNISEFFVRTDITTNNWDIKYFQIQLSKFLQSLSMQRDIISLGITECKEVTADALKDIHYLTNLEELNLSGTQVTNSVVKTLKSLQCLKRLNLYRTNVTKHGINILKQVLKNCVIGY